MLYLPTFVFIWGLARIAGALAFTLQMTCSDPKLDDTRYAIFTYFARWINYFMIILSGYAKVEKKELKHICYKKYLGDDWKPKFEGAPTLICNHRSWLDIMIGYCFFNACFVGKTAV